MIERLVLASNNEKKTQELSDMLAPLGIQLLSQSLFNVPDAEEPHETFVENALAKARHASMHTGLPALADDSGLCVMALDGAPGVRSARFAGEPKSDQRNNDYLLEKLQGVADRRAFFYSVIVFVHHDRDPRPLIADGEWHGVIIDEARGSNGFGYDPLFYLPELEQSAAEIDAALKNTISHRAAAVRHMIAQLHRLQGG